ncbi:hypothetical protein TNCT_405471 [Trichonephila clavata]|uniref:Uncharacterized protein n=1 Tax=Trichonephila clavata TaxID=2740835 RepID=A0A8X6FEP2_TRICU|nr:hypothetical protein TNCT_405471 [Trichonephila clavata]
MFDCKKKGHWRRCGVNRSRSSLRNDDVENAVRGNALGKPTLAPLFTDDAIASDNETEHPFFRAENRNSKNLLEDVSVTSHHYLDDSEFHVYSSSAAILS